MKVSHYRDHNYYLGFKGDLIVVDLELEITSKLGDDDKEIFTYEVKKFQVQDEEAFARFLIQFLNSEALQKVHDSLTQALAAELDQSTLFTFFYYGDTNQSSTS